MFSLMAFFIQDLASILPMPDAVVVLKISGTKNHYILANFYHEISLTTIENIEICSQGRYSHKEDSHFH